MSLILVPFMFLISADPTDRQQNESRLGKLRQRVRLSQILGWLTGRISTRRWSDVGDQVSVDPVDNAGVRVLDLEEGGDFGISGATAE